MRHRHLDLRLRLLSLLLLMLVLVLLEADGPPLLSLAVLAVVAARCRRSLLLLFATSSHLMELLHLALLS